MPPMLDRKQVKQKIKSMRNHVETIREYSAQVYPLYKERYPSLSMGFFWILKATETIERGLKEHELRFVPVALTLLEEIENILDAEEKWI